MNRAVLQRLKELVRESNEVEAERLISTLKNMMQRAPELKIENRMIVLCEINDKTSVFSIAQARIIKALAPTIAPKVFTKSFYFKVLTALQEELNMDEIDD